MRATSLYLTIVVAAAMAAGMVAFLVSTPDQSTRVPVDALGFTSLQRPVVMAGLGHAAEHHRAATATLVGGRAAARNARAWLLDRAAPTAARPTGVRPRSTPESPMARRRVRAFTTWADGIPAANWQVTAGAPRAAEDAPLTWKVAATVVTSVAQAQAERRRQPMSMELEVAGSSPDAKGIPTRWSVVDVQPDATSGWLRAYGDPVVVGRGAVNVVAPTDARPEAAAVERLLAATLAPIGSRYAGSSAPDAVTAWLVQGDAQARRVTGRAAPDRSVLASDDPHRVAWLDPRGDLVVDLPRWLALDGATRSATIRHQVAHLALQRVDGRVPAILVEGIALAEASRTGDGAPVLDRASLRRLSDAFGTAESGVARLLVAPATQQLDGELERIAASATVTWMLEERGADDLRGLLALLDSGRPVDAALRGSIGLAPRGVERMVAAWTRAQVAPVAAVDDDVPQEETTP